jgi:hypothetical protein
MSDQLQGKKIAILAADGVEKVELEQPRAVLEGEGAQVQLLSLKSGEIQARNHDLEPAGTFQVDRVVSDVSVDEFDGLVLPGGTVNPDKLRLDSSAVAFVRNLPRPLDIGRGRRGSGSEDDVISEYSHRSTQRRGAGSRRRGRGRRQYNHQSVAV